MCEEPRAGGGARRTHARAPAENPPQTRALPTSLIIAEAPFRPSGLRILPVSRLVLKNPSIQAAEDVAAEFYATTAWPRNSANL